MTRRTASLSLATLFLVLSTAAPAQTEPHRATRLGNPATRFADPLKSPDDLRRTLTSEALREDVREVAVEIVGFDAQACGGTHVATTAEVGHFRITRTDNKGRINKRLYVRLDD